MDGAKHGLVFSSGMGAATTITQMLTSGDRILCSDDIYGGTYLMFTKVLSKMLITVDFVEMTDLTKFEAAIKPNTRVCY